MLTTDQITCGLADVVASPNDQGKLELIVIRPAVGKREFRPQVYLSTEGGVEGDRWLNSRWLVLPDGRPDPRVQISLMNARILRLISGAAEDQMCLAGDNLIVDFNLSADNLSPGQRLSIGEAVIEITDVAHNGCGKFLSRYGKDAVKFINSAKGKRLHLRGLFAQVIRSGMVGVGDRIYKVRP
jgi:MOSC domain-containing protein YiiM